MRRFSCDKSGYSLITFAILILVTAAAGWVSGNMILASYHPGWKAMAPLTVFTLLMLNISFLITLFSPKVRVPSLLILAVMAAALLSVVSERIGVTDIRIERMLIPSGLEGSIDRVNTGVISPLTLIVLIALNAVCILRTILKSRIRDTIAACAGIASGFAGIIDVCGYVYGNQILSGVISCPTGIVFVLDGMFLIASSDPESFPARIFTGNGTSAIILRHMLPVVLITVIAGGFVSGIPSLFHYDRVVTAAVFIVLFVGLTMYLCGRISSRMGRVIERMAAEREAARIEKARAENRYKTLVESLQEGIAVVDEKSVIRYANPRFIEMTGADMTVDGMSLFRFFKTEYVCTDEFDLCIRSGGILMKDCELTGINGGSRFVSLTLVPFTKMGEFFTGAIVGVVDITDKKEAEQRLVESIENREVLLRELYHRTKNNMQVICSLIRLRSADVSDEVSRSLFREIEGRILAMALVHEKLYESKNLARIDIRAYTVDLAKIILSHALANGDRINVKIEIPEMAIPIDVAIPYGLLITELMTNSYKHAFPGQSTGTVNLSISPVKENVVSFTYTDDGKGISDDFDIGNQRTFGMRMIMNLIEHQLHGTVEVDGRNGFMLRAVFPCTPGDRMADIRFSV